MKTNANPAALAKVFSPTAFFIQEGTNTSASGLNCDFELDAWRSIFDDPAASALAPEFAENVQQFKQNKVKLPLLSTSTLRVKQG